MARRSRFRRIEETGAKSVRLFLFLRQIGYLIWVTPTTRPYLDLWITEAGLAVKILAFVVYYCHPPGHCAGWYLHHANGEPSEFIGRIYWFCDPPSRPLEVEKAVVPSATSDA